MRNFITNLFNFLLPLTALVSLIVFTAWLFDCYPKNLYLVWSYCYKSLAVSFLLFILFGRK